MLCKILIGALMLGIAGSASLAGAVDQAVVAELQKQGYTSVTVSTTWLGRILISARLDGGHREIVINPKTGEILRDYSSGAIKFAQDDGNEGSQTVAGGATAVDTAGGGTTTVTDTSDGPPTAIEVLPKEVVTTKEAN